MSAGEDTATRDTATRNLELVKRAYASWQNGDLDAFVADYTEDVEVRPYLGRSLGASTYHGHTGLRQWYTDATGEWDRLDVAPDLEPGLEPPEEASGMIYFVFDGSGYDRHLSRRITPMEACRLCADTFVRFRISS